LKPPSQTGKVLGVGRKFCAVGTDRRIFFQKKRKEEKDTRNWLSLVRTI